MVPAQVRHHEDKPGSRLVISHIGWMLPSPGQAGHLESPCQQEADRPSIGHHPLKESNMGFCCFKAGAIASLVLRGPMVLDPWNGQALFVNTGWLSIEAG